MTHGITAVAAAMRIAAEAIEGAAAALASAPPADEADRARIQALASDPVLRARLFLVSAGIPFDAAFALGDTAREVWCTILAEQLGERGPMEGPYLATMPDR